MAFVPDGVRRKKLSLGDLVERSRAHPEPEPLEEGAVIDRTRLFVCPTLLPLFYTAAYRELTPAQALRANQITALYMNELIGFFEKAFAPPLLLALQGSRAAALAPELREALALFAAEERRHSEMFRRLNRLSAADWYAAGDYHVLAVPPLAQALLGILTRHPLTFPVVLWLMLAMEEHSIEVSRRCGLLPRDLIEPHWAAVYRAHLEDEVRHVQVDWHLLERFYENRPAALRRANALLLRFTMASFFVKPTRTGPRVATLLAAEFPELRPLLPRMVRELACLGGNADYVAMMYSRAATPLTFALFDRFPELHGMSRVLLSYTPPAGGRA